MLGQLPHLHVRAAPPAQRGALGAVVSLRRRTLDIRVHMMMLCAHLVVLHLADLHPGAAAGVALQLPVHRLHVLLELRARDGLVTARAQRDVARAVHGVQLERGRGDLAPTGKQMLGFMIRWGFRSRISTFKRIFVTEFGHKDVKREKREQGCKERR